MTFIIRPRTGLSSLEASPKCYRIFVQMNLGEQESTHQVRNFRIQVVFDEASYCMQDARAMPERHWFVVSCVGVTAGYKFSKLTTHGIQHVDTKW